MVSLVVDNPDTRGLEAQKAIEDRPVVGKVLDRIADEEFEKVTHDDEQVRFSLQSGEESQKRPVISVFGLTEVGICYEYDTHCGTILNGLL